MGAGKLHLDSDITLVDLQRTATGLGWVREGYSLNQSIKDAVHSWEQSLRCDDRKSRSIFLVQVICKSRSISLKFK